MILGQTFGSWRVIGRAVKPNFFLCKCLCGVVRAVRGTSLRASESKSCGCSRVNNGRKPIHGECKKEKRSKEWIAWKSMKGRCNNPNNEDYSNYGGRGITVCDKWNHSFESFLEDVGRAPSLAHTIDRKDNDGNYEPGNVRWATRSEQTKNSRRARLIVFRGRTMNLCDWAKETGINRKTIQMRLDRSDWPIEKALTT